MTDRPDYLTTKELAALLRIKERKVYELASGGALPVSRVTGKLLFPRTMIEAWLRRSVEGGDPEVYMPELPAIAAGSHDPLFDWALRESGAGLATYFDGSLDGLDRFADRRAMCCGLHLYEGVDRWNIDHVSKAAAALPAVLIEWAWRERGLITAEGNPLGLKTVSDLTRVRFVPRQQESGSRLLLDHALAEAGIEPTGLDLTQAARTEADVAARVSAGDADCGLGLRSMAREHRLDFVPLWRERFDVLVFRKAYFAPTLQSLIAFTRTEAFAARTAELTGYDISGLGTVHWNAG